MFCHAKNVSGNNTENIKEESGTCGTVSNYVHWSRLLESSATLDSVLNPPASDVYFYGPLLYCGHFLRCGVMAFQPAMQAQLQFIASYRLPTTDYRLSRSYVHACIEGVYPHLHRYDTRKVENLPPAARQPFFCMLGDSTSTAEACPLPFKI